MMEKITQLTMPMVLQDFSAIPMWQVLLKSLVEEVQEQSMYGNQITNFCSRILISRKIWVAEKLLEFHTVENIVLKVQMYVHISKLVVNLSIYKLDRFKECSNYRHHNFSFKVGSCILKSCFICPWKKRENIEIQIWSLFF